MSDMTDDERSALEWLEQQIRDNAYGEKHPGSYGHEFLTNGRILKAMLSRPVVPDANDHKAIDGILHRLAIEGGYTGATRNLVCTILRIMHEPPKPADQLDEIRRWGT